MFDNKEFESFKLYVFNALMETKSIMHSGIQFQDSYHILEGSEKFTFADLEKVGKEVFKKYTGIELKGNVGFNNTEITFGEYCKILWAIIFKKNN